MRKPSLLRRRLPRFLAGLLTLVGVLSACNLQQQTPNQSELRIFQAETATPTETIPPYTPLATLTPSQTLRPPPTFEPPTATLPATLTPTITLTSTLDLGVSIPGLHGAETPTPTTTPGCEPRKDWKLRYTVVRGDALAKIADLYSTSVDALLEGNCLTDPNLIVIDQVLRVPGDAPPVQVYECDAWEVLTPLNGTLAIPGEGTLTFNWRGPRAAHNLIRIIRPDTSIVEFVTDLRQNETITLVDNLAASGTYTWYVYPLDANYVQIPCKEGGPWTFTKALSPTLTPTRDPNAPAVP
jgi:LysM repeat protein